MNRSILIVICDFLLVSLIAFSNFESTPEQREAKLDVTPERKTPANDIAGSLKLALEDERQAREKLAAELASTRESAQSSQSEIAARDARLKEFQENLQRTEAQTKQLQEQRSALEQQVAATQNNLQSLQSDLALTRQTAKLSNDQLAALQADLRRRQAEADTLRQRLAEMEKVQSNVITAKQQLDTKIQVAEAEKRLTQEQLAVMRSEVQTVRQEKAQLAATTTKLAEGVTTLAQSSSNLTQEIRENRPLAANTIFNDFAQNRVGTEFLSTRSGIFGREVRKKREAQTLLVNDGTATYAIYHISDTPLTLWPPGVEWEALTGFLTRGVASVAIQRIAFLAQDPRILVAPLDAASAKALGAKIYKTAGDPLKFADAVVVGANEGYYGECKFQIDPTTPDYVKMDRSVLKGLFGKFNPSRGDLVLSKTGELLGIMVNNDYCAVLKKINPSFTIQTGDNLRTQGATQLLDQQGARLHSMPLKLQ